MYVTSSPPCLAPLLWYSNMAATPLSFESLGTGCIRSIKLQKRHGWRVFSLHKLPGSQKIIKLWERNVDRRVVIWTPGLHSHIEKVNYPVHWGGEGWVEEKLPARTVDVYNLRGGGTSDYRTGVVTGAKPNLVMVSWFFCLGISVNA